MARAGVSQHDVAAVLGLSQTGVSRRLSGRVDFSATELAKLAAHLNVPVAVFFADALAASPEGGEAA